MANTRSNKPWIASYKKGITYSAIKRSEVMSTLRLICSLTLLSLFVFFTFQLPISPACAEKERNEIIAGVHGNFPPQYSIDEKTGKPTGFAIDTMDEIAGRAGLKVRYIVFAEWPPIFRALKEGRIDIIPNVGIIEERKPFLDFTSPVDAFFISIFVRESTTDIHGLDDLAGRSVAVVADNKGVGIIRAYGKAKPVIFQSLEEALLSLLSGNTDALIYPEPPVLRIARKSRLEEQIKTAGKPLLEVKRAIAVGKGKTELFGRLDKTVKAFTGTLEYKRLYIKWFGTQEPYWNVRRITFAAVTVIALIITIFAAWHYLSLMRLNRKLRTSLAQQKISEEKLLLKNLVFDASIAANSIADLDGTIAEANAAFLRTWGYQSRDEVIGKAIPDFIRYGEEAVAMTTALNEAGQWEGDYTAMRRDGSTFLAHGLATVIRDAKGKVIGYQSAATDITDRKWAEDKIKSLLQEKELLLKEVHHRIKNNMSVILSLLSLQSSTLKDPRTISFLEDAGSRVRSMMILYDKLYRSDDFRGVSTKKYISSLVGEITGNFPNRGQIEIETRIDDLSLDAKTLSPVGLIINELLTNTMKHAFAGKDEGRILVSLSKRNNHITLITENNGNTLPESVDMETATGFGLQLVSMLIKQLEGSIRIERENGTRFILEFDLSPESPEGRP
jgi:PAS domain S-box-containing protein